MQINIVLACHNGAPWIVRQLESIRQQTRHPDHVLIVDDCSTDATAQIVQAYIREHDLAGWQLKINQETLGWKVNFFRAMQSVGEGMIFLCDQDDQWRPTKIEKMARAMEADPRICVMACDYELVYEENAVVMKKYRKKKRERVPTVAQYRFTSRFFQNPSPGCTYVVCGDFLRRAETHWFAQAPHDEFLWLMASLLDGAFFYNETLMQVFRHGSNSSDIRYKDIALQQENLRYIRRMLDAMERFAAENTAEVSPDKLRHLRRAGEWCAKRQRLMTGRNPVYWVGMMPYWKYYNSFRNCLSDLYLTLFGSFTR